jgi:hypothetical protein
MEHVARKPSPRVFFCHLITEATKHQQSNYIIESIKLLRYRLIKRRSKKKRRTQQDGSEKRFEPLAVDVIDVLPLRISSSMSAHDQHCAKRRTAEHAAVRR